VFCAQARLLICLNINSGAEGANTSHYLTGEPTNIFHLAEFGYFDVVWFISPEGPDSIQIIRLGRYTGPAETVGSLMCAIVCNEKPQEYHHTSVFSLTLSDKVNPDILKRIEEFNRAMSDNFY
jgi:hypothetical protein